MTFLAAVILAGGRSSRMGHDKALISLGAETLIERTCGVALAGADAVYVVTPWPQRYAALLPASVNFVAEPAAPEPPEPPPGPMVALVQVLEMLQAQPEARPEWVLLLACDMPNLSAPVLSTWRQGLAALPPLALAYLPQRQGRWEPLCGFYRATALDDLRQYLSTGGRSFQPWLNQRSVVPIALTTETVRMLANLNTPADLAHWQEQITS